MKSPRPNPFTQLKLEIQELQRRTLGYIKTIQVPTARANEICTMDFDEWKEGAPFLFDSQIGKIIERCPVEGAAVLNELKLGYVSLAIADRVEDDCNELVILKTYETPPDEV
ncbi:MAG: hypothetical protein JWO08_3314 [Verrucomicrobiaceae bacterium]|nr:hypothetical protein [Verrucomicrobiaceae bacterium]